MLVINGANIKNGVAFMMKDDRRRYVVLTAHRDDTVSYDLEKNVRVNYFGRVVGNITTHRVSNDSFITFFRKVVESSQEKKERLLAERRSANERYAEMENDFNEAIKWDILVDASKGNLGKAIERMNALLSETRTDGYYNGHGDGHSEGHSDGYTEGHLDGHREGYQEGSG